MTDEEFRKALKKIKDINTELDDRYKKIIDLDPDNTDYNFLYEETYEKIETLIDDIAELRNSDTDFVVKFIESIDSSIFNNVCIAYHILLDNFTFGEILAIAKAYKASTDNYFKRSVQQILEFGCFYHECSLLQDDKVDLLIKEYEKYVADGRAEVNANVMDLNDKVNHQMADVMAITKTKYLSVTPLSEYDAKELTNQVTKALIEYTDTNHIWSQAMGFTKEEIQSNNFQMTLFITITNYLEREKALSD